MTIRRAVGFASVLLALLSIPRVRAAQAPADYGSGLEALYGGEQMISLATGYEQPLVQAPSTVTVVTRPEIEALSVRSLANILDHVAGFHVMPSEDGRGFVMTERGRDRPVLFEVNGVPYVKGLIFGWQDLNDVLPYDIQRIEIVRGPASAVYGGNAAGGVINIITRSDSGFEGVEAGARVGSFASKDGWVEAGTRWEGIALNFYGAARSSDQTDAWIDRDAQSYIDGLLGTRASRAPGPLAGHRNVTTARAVASDNGWTLSLAQFAETDYHVGAGIAEALDPDGIYDNRLTAANLTYRGQGEGLWTVSGYLSYSQDRQSAHTAFYPPGAFGGLFPQGVLDGLKDHEDRLFGEVSLLRRSLGAHDVRIGVGGLYNRFVLDDDIRNFVIRDGMALPTGIFAPGAGVGDPLAIAPTTLQAKYVYVQDAWLMAPDWRLTSGLRWDQYGSFGSIVNPRLGLVWAATERTSLKLLFGTAFGPPGLTDTSSNGIFGALGNPNLRPERTKSLEFSAEYNLPGLRADATVYGYQDSDLIVALPSSDSVNGLEYFNQGRARGMGFESDVHYTSASGILLAATYAYHQFLGRGQDVSPDVALAAKHELTTEASVPLFGPWTWHFNTETILGRRRMISDPRPAPGGYTLVGTDIAWHSRYHLITISGGARNLLNTDAREPNSTPEGVYYDLPLPGRELFVKAAVRL